MFNPYCNFVLKVLGVSQLLLCRLQCGREENPMCSDQNFPQAGPVPQISSTGPEVSTVTDENYSHHLWGQEKGHGTATEHTQNVSQSSSKGKLQPHEEQGVESFIKHRNDQAFGEEHKHQHDCPSKGDKETSISKPP